MISICLSERFVRGRAGEVIRTVHGMVLDKEAPAFEAAFVLVQEFAFGVKEFWALFAEGKCIHSRGQCGGLSGIIIGVGSTAGRGFTGVIVMMGGVAILFGDTLIFLPICTEYIVTSLALIKPLLEVNGFVQFSEKTFFDNLTSIPAPS
jgi:hypothetical protein